jgi:FKBP-type peptidyl-prolyl cis-trans isomerase (trigger factor)/Fe-S-cluster containining protein
MSKLEAMSGGSIQRPAVTITDEDVGEVLLTLRKQRMQWKPVKRPARLGDRVAITYTLMCRGKIIEAHETIPRLVELGSDKFNKSLERRSLLGAREGEKISAKALLPSDYPDSNLAGKRVVFHMIVIEVCNPVLPTLNRQFAVELGLSTGGAKTMQKEVRGIMQREVDSTIKQLVRKQVTDILLSKYLLVVNEEEIQREVTSRQRAQTKIDQKKQPDEDSSKLTVEQAWAFARLNAIMKDIIRTEKLVVDTQRLKTTVTALAQRADNPEVATRRFYKKFEELSRIEAEMLEDQIIELVLGYLSVESIVTTYKEFTSAQNTSSLLGDWPTHPIIQLRTDNKCSFCGPSKCCQYITQKISAPRSKQDFDHLLWQVSHEKVEIFKDSDGWHLLVDTTCTHLQADGGCGIYENRPSVCRDYSVKNCEFDGAASDGWKLYFSDHDSLLGYCKQRFRRWESE